LFSDRTTRRWLSLAAVAASGALLLAGCAGTPGDGGTGDAGGDSDDFRGEYTLVTVTNPTSSMGPPQEWYLDEVERRTEGRITFIRTEPGEICAPGEVYDCLADGRAQIIVQVPNYQPSYLAANSLPEIIFGTENLPAVTAAMYELLQTNQATLDYLEKANLHHVGTWPVGRILYGSREPVTDIDQIRGQAVRTSGTIVVQSFEAIGASLVAVPAQEAYQAVQSGLATAVAGAMDFPTAFKLGEILPHWTDPGIGNYSEFSMFWAKDVWDSFPEDIRQILLEIEAELNAGTSYDLWREYVVGQCTQLADMPTVETLTVWDAASADEWARIVADGNDALWVEQATGFGLADAENVLEEYRQLVAKYEPQFSTTDPVIECANGGFEAARR